MSVADTVIGAIAFGSSSRSMIRASPAPSASAATAKSRSRSARICACTIRATSIQVVQAISRMIENTSVETKAASVSSRNTFGKHSTASTRRISTAPIAPP
jgi:hypothetical protein